MHIAFRYARRTIAAFSSDRILEDSKYYNIEIDLAKYDYAVQLLQLKLLTEAQNLQENSRINTLLDSD